MSRVKWGRSPGSEFNMAHVNILRVHITEGVDLGLMMSHMSKSYFLRSARGVGRWGAPIAVLAAPPRGRQQPSF